MTNLKTLAQTISGLTSRREHALSVLSKVLGLSFDELNPAVDWNSLAVRSYLESRPFCLYYELAFTEYYRHLHHMYANNLALFASDFTTCGHDLWKAIGTAESISTEIENEDLDQLHPFTAVTRHLHQWYLRLVEQAFDSLLGLAAYRLQTNKGKQLPPKPWNIYEVMKNHGWHSPGTFYHPIVRNGIAHEFDFISDPSLAGWWGLVGVVGSLTWGFVV